MLGYVRTQPSELRLRDFECYRAIYCGLCRHMKVCTGNCSRLSLSYDFVFLAAARISLIGEPVAYENFRCLLHPFRKRKALKKSPTLAYCADASALLTHYKCMDDRQDEHGFRRFRARLLSFLFSRAYRKAKKRHPDLDRKISDALYALQKDETASSAPPSADLPASRFGALLSCIFSEGLDGTDARIAASLGHAIGCWIYFADAVDDFEKDRKTGSFNPLRRLFGDVPTARDWEDVETVMLRYLEDAECAYQLIDRYPVEELKEILANILYLGLPGNAKKLIEKRLKEAHNQNEEPV